ncbi:MAG: serine/threonine protein kinase [Nocardioides sp.]
MTGDRFADDASRYRLEGLVATGGMGEVWRGTDTLLDRAVAVKLLRREYAEDETFRGRFQTEARHAAALHHPHVAAVFDVGESGGRPFLVMELVPGQPLSALLADGRPLVPAVVRDLVGQAASGLAAAHARGIVHRDVKPANLLVTPEGRVKITDFGIARAADSVAVTQPGTVLGTPFYLAPEQARGETAGPAADVYALGVVAHECLTGRRPFAADTPVGTALAHLRDPVPDLPPSVPADLAVVVHRALAKDPADRYPDAAALTAALAATGQGRAPAAPAPAPAPTRVLDPDPVTRQLPPVPAYSAAPGPTPWWWRWWVAAGAVAAVLLVALLVATLGDSGPPDGPVADPPRPSAEASSKAPVGVRVAAADYVGEPALQAQRELSGLGLDVTVAATPNPGDQRAGTVEGVAPTGVLEAGTAVTVTSWGPAPTGGAGDPGKEQPGKGKDNGKGKGKK